MRIPRPWERWRPGCCIHPGRLPCGPSALFNIGDLTLSLYESELATGLLPNKITDLSSLSNSGEARLPILNRAAGHQTYHLVVGHHNLPEPKKRRGGVLTKTPASVIMVFAESDLENNSKGCHHYMSVITIR